jgi:hypothetical protein
MTQKFWMIAIGAAAILAGTTLAPPPAAAAAKKRVASVTSQQVVTTRPRARVTVQRRSYLDPGNYIIPGEDRSRDYANPPGYSPLSVIENTPFYHRSPLPGPYDLPGRDNPYPWNWCPGC